MLTQNHQERFAVITGASRGIGAEYARALAKRGYALLLVGRDTQRLQEVAKEATQLGSIHVTTSCIDLSTPHSAHQLFVAAQDCQHPIGTLINNAGFGMYGDFATMPLPSIQQMLQLHVHTVVESTRLFLPQMIERRSGIIINVSSVAGFFPIPYMAEYAATKAFLNSFSEALAEEVRESGVIIQACCPGYTKTDFHRTAGHTPRNPLPPQSIQSVVHASLRGIENGQSSVTVGWQGWLAKIAARYLPRRMLIQMAGNRTTKITRLDK